jgi:hypothetical protein
MRVGCAEPSAFTSQVSVVEVFVASTGIETVYVTH